MFKSLAVASFRKTLLALGAAATLGAAAPAVAGGFIDTDVIYAEPAFDGGRHPRPIVRPAPVIEDYDVIPAKFLVRELRNQGYGRVREISLRGDEYRVTAVRNNGALFRLRVDAYSGDILSARRIGWVSAQPRPMPRRHVEPGFSLEFGWSGN